MLIWQDLKQRRKRRVWNSILKVDKFRNIHTIDFRNVRTYSTSPVSVFDWYQRQELRKSIWRFTASKSMVCVTTQSDINATNLCLASILHYHARCANQNSISPECDLLRRSAQFLKRNWKLSPNSNPELLNRQRYTKHDIRRRFQTGATYEKECGDPSVMHLRLFLVRSCLTTS